MRKDKDMMDGYDVIDDEDIDDETEEVIDDEDLESEDEESEETSEDLSELRVVHEEDNIQANVNGTTVADILGLQKLSKYNRMTHNSIERYDIDVEIYEDIVAQSEELQKTLYEGEKVLASFKYLQQDLFLALFKYEAVMVDESKVYPSVRMNRGILEQIFDTNEFIELRKSCRFDVYNAAVGSEILGKVALDMMKKMIDDMAKQEGEDAIAEQLENLDKLVEAEENLDSLLDNNDEIDQMIEDMQNQQQDELTSYAEAQELQEQIDQLSQIKQGNELSLQQGKAIANKLANQSDKLIQANDKLTSDCATQIVKSMPDITKDIHNVTQMAHAWGLGTGNTTKIPFASKKKAIAKLRKNSKLERITDILGKMKDTAVTEQRKKSKHGAVEIKSVTIGDKIEDTLPSERMNMCNDVTKRDFMRRMTEHSLLTYHKESAKNKNKGPIIVCVDTSGSMSGTREVWSKSLAISVLEIAQMQKRDFACILYSSYADNPIIIKKGEIAPDKVIKIAEDFEGGGTNFERPLKKAMDLIEDSTFKEADILFISDGDCYISDSFKKEFKQKKEDKEFKCKGILINAGGDTSDSSLKEFCDDVTYISKIADMTDGESDMNKKIFSSF